MVWQWRLVLILVMGAPAGAGLCQQSSPQVTIDVLGAANQRFEELNAREAPNFRRHVVPLMGRLGCNGRTCHGSFQGQGGFRLSLFGYDFTADHEALVSDKEPRADAKNLSESLMLYKPTHGDEHGGGERMKQGSWQYNLIKRWIESGAANTGGEGLSVTKLDIQPPELLFTGEQKQIALRVTACWSDGSAEDVTPLCRYQINDESVAEVDADGKVTIKDSGDTHLVVFYDSAVAVAPLLRPISARAGADYPAVSTSTKIDELIVAKLRKLGIVPSEICSDTEFLRRVSLDMTATLPTPQEIEAFVADTSRDKRAKKIDELLTRPAYVARWTTKLCEITGNSPRHFQDQAPPEEYSRHWYEWIARRVRENEPYDKLVAGIVLGRSRRPDQSYDEYIAEQSTYYRAKDPADFTARETMPYYWAKRTSRTPEERALNFSYAFLGVRIECAQCHKHPFDRWTKDDFRSFTALFDRVGFGVAPNDRKQYQAMLSKLGDSGNQGQRVRARLERAQKGEVVPWPEVYLADQGTRVEKGNVAKATESVAPRLLGDRASIDDSVEDPRQPLMEWMRRKDNPYFARVFINRVWAEYFGVGIINPPDDMNLANPPSNAALLDYLAESFVEREFDMKWLHREIANSEAYQRSIRSNETNRLDERNFSRATARRLTAEALFDAIDQATSGSAEMARATIDVTERAIGPKGGSLVGRFGDGKYTPVVFGRSPRDTNCDCGASNEPNLLQAIYVRNDKEILAAIDRKNGWISEVATQRSKKNLQDAAGGVDAMVREAFLRTVSRPPTEIELARCRSHLDQVGNAKEGLQELLWALLNTREFITNH